MDKNALSPGIDALKFAWAGEIYGMAFFAHMRDHYPEQQDVWQTLYEIEHFTEHYLSQQLAGVISLTDAERQEMVEKGVREASEWLHWRWQALCPRMRDWIEPWQETYQRWHQQSQQLPAPGSEQPWQAEFTLLQRHETAIFVYWQAAANGDQQAYARLLTDFARLRELVHQAK